MGDPLLSILLTPNTVSSLRKSIPFVLKGLAVRGRKWDTLTTLILRILLFFLAELIE
jgi:hypothetical protein